MKIRVLIAEDEPIAQEELMYLLEEQPDVHLCPCAGNGQQLLELYSIHRPDVVFLDVHMPHFSGMEAAKRIIRQEQGDAPLFVFTTAYDEYALQAFEIEAVDYLLKPFDDARFNKAFSRVRQQLSRRLMHTPQRTVSRQVHQTKLLVDDGEKTVVLTPDMIYYAVPNQRALEIHTKEKVIISKMTLQEFEQRLKGQLFFRTHRSYLVNINYILEITPWFNGTSNVTLSDKANTQIPVSRAARKELFQLLEMQG